jgi:hypothetical protein
MMLGGKDAIGGQGANGKQSENGQETAGIFIFERAMTLAGMILASHDFS